MFFSKMNSPIANGSASCRNLEMLKIDLFNFLFLTFQEYYSKLKFLVLLHMKIYQNFNAYFIGQIKRRTTKTKKMILIASCQNKPIYLDEKIFETSIRQFSIHFLQQKRDGKLSMGLFSFACYCKKWWHAFCYFIHQLIEGRFTQS